jgi:hypothetical protein
MGIARFVVVAAVAAMPVVVSAQSSERALSPLEIAVACSSPVATEVPADPMRVSGSQDTVPRTVFGKNDMLVLNRGASHGVRTNQRYFLRHPTYFGTTRGAGAVPQAITTTGWVRVVSVNDTMALATVEHFCGAIFESDYLEPFVAPSLPSVAGPELRFEELDFSAPGRVMLGTENHTSGGAGDLMTIDRGTEHGVAPGARFAIYRDVHMSEVPASDVGEGVVLTAAKTTSLVQITRSRDAVVTGDYVVLRK